MIDDRKPGVEVRGASACLIALFLLFGSFGGLLYLISLLT